MTLTMMSRAGRFLCDWAEGQGVARREVRDALGVPEALLRDPEGRIPAERFLDALGPATRSTPGARPGLIVPQGWGVELFDVLGYLVYTSPTLRVALQRIIDFKDLWSQAEDLWLEEREETAHVFWRLNLGEHPSAAVMVDMAYADILGGTQAMFEGRRVPVREVFVPGEAPEDRSAHEAFASGAQVHFGAPWLEIVYDREVLGWEMPRADEMLHGYFEGRARALRDSLGGGGVEESATRKVRAIVGRSLVGGPPGLDEVAAELGASARTVQRWLSGEGTSFGEVVEQARRELACEHLRRRRLSVAEVSWLLGYAEPRAFHRAFKRWMGQTPGRYREANMGQNTT